MVLKVVVDMVMMSCGVSGGRDCSVGCDDGCDDLWC